MIGNSVQYLAIYYKFQFDLKHKIPIVGFNLIRIENTHLKGKYHCTLGPQFDWIGFNRPSKYVDICF